MLPLHSLWTVSYTHLDVYKRQIIYSVSAMDWLLAVSCWLLAIGTIGAIRVIGSLISNLQSPFTYLYREIRPIPSFLEYPRGKYQISTWIFFLPHVGANHFFRSFISFLRSFISFLRRIFYSPPGDFEISTWKSVFPDTAP